MRTVNDSYTSAAAVTPDDDTVIAPTRALYIGTTGNVAVQMVDGTTATFPTVPVGVITLSVKKVLSTDTTASNILALR